ncbi:MAG: competence/damage-inducible protein A [Bacteroidaceae bacterium]|nr:competence/damage-inducible protein A [Bacteroidaceae bacterium]
MNVEIITIGDELLIGQVVDTNSAWMAKELNAIGAEVLHITTVRDRKDEMIEAFNEAFTRVNVVLVTGGLGPTKDDITKQTLCDYFGTELVFSQEVYAHLENLLQRRGLQMNESNRAQALVPESCTVIQNAVGTAPIMWFEHDGRILVSMPGVPSEMKQVMTSDIIPRLSSFKQDAAVIVHHTCLVRNFAESVLSEFLDDFERNMPEDIKLAYLPTPGLIRLRLTARGTDEEKTKRNLDGQVKKLCGLLGNNILCNEDLSLTQIVGKFLKERGWMLSTAESCTGGNIAHQITKVPGSSAYFKGSVVAYSNEVKENVLGVSAADLTAFGAVSDPVVRQMCDGVCRLMNTECSVAVSGIAGPDGGTPDKPVGTVWIAAKCGDKIQTQLCSFASRRENNIARATQAALLLLVSLFVD